jgi:alkaline phosphatase D
MNSFRPILLVAFLVASVVAMHGLCDAQDKTASKPISRMLFGSCAKQDKPAPIFKTIVSHRPELFVFLGDNIYGDTTDMNVLKAKYAKLAAIDGFSELTSACPILATWDDHDYGVNDGGADYPKRVQSQKVFLNFWKEPADSVRRKRPGIYDSSVFGPEGKRLQVILLDTRYFRSALKKGAKRRTGGPYAPDPDPSKTMLGEAQWKWLKKQLMVPAELRVIATSIQSISEDDGQETWSNLPTERKRLFRLVQETKANGVIFISGDRHWSELSRIQDGLKYPLYDLTSSSFNQSHPRGTPTKNRFRHIATTYHKENFGAIEVDWNQPDPTVTLEIRDMANKVQLEKTLKLSDLK